jgi:hypothetical protein
MTTDTVSAKLTASAITLTKHDLMRDWAAGIISDIGLHPLRSENGTGEHQ